ncbi:hypothetical protein CYMTET_45118 [Cymbomonas tetramitiformis]|uniref:Uncharacterized protein n=1 Tax=Cymbomonas tetramitiformis TaxID=36881 RepID=A0AAE0BYW2_9CHLO|nr:hypothetical protein CYMTET_45118 [Cymbomonas tetramitiformis]
MGDYTTTYIPPTGKSVIWPKNTGMTTDRSKLRRLQQEVEMLQKYLSGEVAGILMWHLSQHVFCVQPEAVKQHIDLMEATLDHGGVDNNRELVEELQFPHRYESSGTWKYQILRYLERVDMDTLREDLHKFWQRCGHLKPPLELVTLAAKGPAKFYPVDDGEGGGEVFTDNASAHEYSTCTWKKVEECSGAPAPWNWGTTPFMLPASADHHHHNLQQQQQWPESLWYWGWSTRRWAFSARGTVRTSGGTDSWQSGEASEVAHSRRKFGVLGLVNH